MKNKTIMLLRENFYEPRLEKDTLITKIINYKKF